MFQVTFSEQSLSVLNSLTRDRQLRIIERMSLLGHEIISDKNPSLGKFNRNGREILRFRYDGLRLYFENINSSLHCIYILPKNSVQDFLVRCKLPSSDEAVVENHKNFWDYLESFSRK